MDQHGEGLTLGDFKARLSSSQSGVVPQQAYDELRQRYDALHVEFEELSRRSTLIKHRHERLKSRFDVIERSYQEALTKCEDYKREYRKGRDSVREWQEWYDRHPKYLKPADEFDGLRVSSRPTSGSSTTAASPRRLDFATANTRVVSSDNDPRERSDHLKLEPTLLLSAGLHEVSEGIVNKDAADERPVLLHSSSQTTQSEHSGNTAEGCIAQMADDEDDTPVLVAERCIKRKRRSANVNQYRPTSAGTPADHIKIKHESSKTSQSFRHQSFGAPRLVSQMSDLDASMQPVHTPRKRQKILHELDTVIDENTPPRRDPSAEQQGLDEHNINHLPSPASRSSQGWKSAGPLTPLSTNAIVKQQGDTTLKARRTHRTNDDHLSRGIRALAGGDSDPSSTKKLTKSHRLEDLLHEDQPSSPRVSISSRTPGNGCSLRDSKFPGTTPSMRDTRVSRKADSGKLPKPTPTIPRVRYKASAQDLGHVDDVRPEDEPLRARPLERLTLDDFRVNPKLTGADYAFKTSIRGNENRRCAPNCTGPCCSTLHRFMNVDTPKTASSKVKLSSSRPASPGPDIADDDLLRAYLGHGQIDSLSVKDRNSLLDAARKDHMAKRYGKHKHLYERPKSPPGFWRTEMPSTQEMEADKKRAEEARAAELERRWREANRGDGKGLFVFRDEL